MQASRSRVRACSWPAFSAGSRFRPEGGGTFVRRKNQTNFRHPDADSGPPPQEDQEKLSHAFPESDPSTEAQGLAHARRRRNAQTEKEEIVADSLAQPVTESDGNTVANSHSRRITESDAIADRDSQSRLGGAR
jgi:hypothetical protein